MRRHVVLGMTASMLCVNAAVLCGYATAQEMLRTMELAPVGNVVVTTELIVKQPGLREFVYTPLVDARPGSVTAFDVSRGQALETHVRKTEVAVVLPSAIPVRAEFRLRLHETVPATGLDLHRVLAMGRYIFVLPPGYSLKSCSLPAQVKTSDDRVDVGVVQGSSVPVPIDLVMEKVGGVNNVTFNGNFLASDNRIVSYQLLDPKDHAIRLWLEMYVDHAGQSHFYSQLRTADDVSNPLTLDMDRGVELPTRILTGKEATAIGDAPAPFPDDAQVLVADLGYKVPAGGSARLRSYQTATDAPNYRLTGPDEFRLDRFIARTRTQYILPVGWSLASMDQPGIVSRTKDGGVQINFVGSTGHESKLTMTGHRDAAMR